MNTVSKMEKAANGAAEKARSTYQDAKASVQSEYPELSDIREDLRALKEDVVGLTNHARSNSGKYVSDAKDYAWSQVERAQDAAHRGMETVERRVKDKPGQTLAAAFVAGIVASFFLRRR